jgi:hypothetical protein
MQEPFKLQDSHVPDIPLFMQKFQQPVISFSEILLYLVVYLFLDAKQVLPQQLHSLQCFGIGSHFDGFIITRSIGRRRPWTIEVLCRRPPVKKKGRKKSYRYSKPEDELTEIKKTAESDWKL